MLSGIVSWFAEDGRLTLRKDGVPAMVYTPFADSPAHTRQWTFHGVGISLPADWPSNAVRCGTPTTNTVIFPGAVTSCAYSRPAGVTSVEFRVFDANYDPFPSPPPSPPGTILIDDVE